MPSDKSPPPLWIPGRDWAGETVFIIGGGPSVAQQNISLLRGRRVICINTSYKVAPWADYLLFADDRWWRHHRNGMEFSGRIVSANKVAHGDKLWRRLERRKPPGMSDKPGVVTVEWTTFTAAIDLAAQLGVRRIVTLGLDNRIDGKKTHHHDPHPFTFVVSNFKNKHKDLASMAAPLKQRGIEVLNASPGSAIDLWPIIDLKIAL